MRKLLLGLLLILGLAGCASLNLPVEDKPVDPELTVHLTVDPVTQTSCSAVMIAPERALTAAHCTDVVSPVMVIGETKYPITNAYLNPDLDLAILFIPGAPCPCATGPTSVLQDGDAVKNIGYPWGGPMNTSDGVVLGRVPPEPEESYWKTELVMSSAWGAPGMSGGGVFNERGELIGILVGGGAMTGIPTLFVELKPQMFGE